MSEVRHYSQERCEVAKAYPGKKWTQKVIQMSDAQIHEIYVNLLKKKEKEKKKRAKSVTKMQI